MIKAMLAAAISMGMAAGADAATAIAPGDSSFVFTDAKGHADRPVPVYTYRPARCDASCPMVFSIHGVNRHASNYRDYWKAAADRYGFVIVAPEFSKQHWSKYNEFDTRAEPDREKWAFSVIEHLFDEVGEGRKDYTIFGHSAGGQFVHRMAFYLPANRASTMAAANPGWYAMPEWRKGKGADAFPYSLVDSGVKESDVRAALRRRFFLLLGDKDTDPNHKDLRRSPEAMKQGATRFERGQAYYKAVSATAAELGEKPGWRLVEVPGVSHQGGPMSRAAADAIFGGQ